MKWIFLSFLLLSFGCHSDNQREKLPRTKVDMKDFDEDIVIPSSLWKAFEDSFPALTENVAGPKGEGGEKEERRSR